MSATEKNVHKYADQTGSRPPMSLDAWEGPIPSPDKGLRSTNGLSPATDSVSLAAGHALNLIDLAYQAWFNQ